MIEGPPFPISIDELDTDTLTYATGQPVVSFAAERIGADRGMLGEIFVIEPAYADGANGPERFVVKFAALREGSLASALRGGAHERELRCYEELLESTPVSVPQPYAAWYDPASAHFLLVQQAIDADDTVDQLRGLTVDQARLVLQQAARLHARWWSDPTLTSLAWLPALDSHQRIRNLTTLARTGWPLLCEMLGDSLAPSERALGATFPDRLEAALRSVARLPHTLLHCDLRADNLLFSPDGSRVTLVDWQGAGVGPPSFDLAYFLSQSLSVDARRDDEDYLLDFYRAELAASGVELTRRDVSTGYAESMHYGLAIACALPLISDPDEPRVRRLAEVVARRSIEALRDHNQLWEEQP